MAEVIRNSYDIIFFVQAKLCNPNGDPDMGNLPRTDPVTNIGYITDVCLKRRIRDYVDSAFEGEDGNDIMVRASSNINEALDSCIEEKPDGVSPIGYVCAKYFDARTFGATLTGGLNGGQILGPVQIWPTMSVDPVETEDITIDCVAVRKTAEEFAKLTEDKKRTFGRKQFVQYGLYPVYVSISAGPAQKVGFTDVDLDVMLESICNLYSDVSASKAGMTIVGPVIIFKHVGTDNGSEKAKARQCAKGCIKRQDLHDLVKIERIDKDKPARDYKDYTLEINKSCGLLEKAGVELMFKYQPFEEPVTEVASYDTWTKII